MDDISPSTWRAIHADEERLLRGQILYRAPWLLGALALWIYTGARPSNPFFFFVGLAALPVGAAAWTWWKHRRSDPLTGRIQHHDDRDAAIAEQALVAERVAARGAYVTYILAGLLLAVGALQLILDGSIDRSIAAAGLVKPAVKAGEWWRLVSATYLHGSWWHIYGNVTALLVLGRYVEAFSPRWRLPVVYSVAGVAGSLASVYLLGTTSVGASGSIIGLAGYLAVLGYLQPGALPKSVRASILATIGLAAYVGAFGYFFIDNAAHAGGLAAGALIAWLTVPRGHPEPGLSPDREPQWNLTGAAAAVLILAGAGGTVLALAHGRPVAVSSVDVSLSSDQIEGHPATSPPSIVITNKSLRTIEAYRVSVRRDGQVLWAIWRDDCCFTGDGAQTPITSHERRVAGSMKSVPGFSLGPSAPHLDVVIFDDGSYEGSDAEYAQLMTQRKWAADAADYWTEVIQQDRALPAEAFRASIAGRLQRRLRESPLEAAAAAALGVSALVASPAVESLEAGRIDDTLTTIAIAQKALRARLAAR